LAGPRDLLAELNRSLDQGRDCVYCAVVETRGSTPQKAGAAMLVFPDGSQSGTLGGGCVEAEVKQRALRVLALGGGQPEVLSFNLDDAYGWDDGLICGGRMTILAEPLLPQASRERQRPEGDGERQEYYRRYLAALEAGHGCIEAVVINPEPSGLPLGNRYLFDADSRLVAQVGSAAAAGEIARQIVPVQQRPRPKVQHGIAYLPVWPRITLLIVGGGHVGQAVAQLAAEVDFDVWVLDDRERYVSRERFATAQRLIVGDIGQNLKELAQKEIDASVFAIIVTRGHAHDEEALHYLATTQASYVGLIGSRRKIKLIYQDLIAKGIPQAALDRVHAPLGFDIGSQTVPEIAVSIVAELIACRNRGRTDQMHHKDVDRQKRTREECA
jgi:xanthine dehydrogenase accessory factor